jgi:hypothetical protein
MSIAANCFDDRYTAEVQSAEVKVWNELTRMFCSVKATLEIADSEDPRNTATLLLEESKVALPSLSKDITYRCDDDFVIVESISATNDQTKELIQDMINRWLEIYVRIEGI